MIENDELDERVESVVEDAMNQLASDLAEEDRDANDTPIEYDAWFDAVLSAFARVYLRKG